MNYPFSQSAPRGAALPRCHWILFVLILILGIFARTWEFGQLPPGLTQDEADTGVEAYDLSHYGVDRNRMAYPVHFISWGDGANVLYAYVLIPFVWLANKLDPTVVRLPNLIAGVASLPLVYLLSRRLQDARFGLLSMFFLAVSPWHILLSRMAIDSNLFPFAFLLGYICLLNVRRHPGWFVPASMILGICLYAYGTSYAMVPAFLTCAVVLFARGRTVSPRFLMLGISAFILEAAPIGIFIVVNIARLHTVNLGPMTIPRLPVSPRFEQQTLLSSPALGQTIKENLANSLVLLAEQSDGMLGNVVDPYGYFYTITFPLALIGIGVLVWELRAGRRGWETGLLFCWLGSVLPIAVLQRFVNITRLNIVFIPLITCMALGLYWLSLRVRRALAISIVALLVAFGGFTIAYHGPEYRRQAGASFSTGLVPALEYASQLGDASICAPGNAYIFVLFAEHQNPAIYLRNIKYDHVRQQNRRVISSGRYTFGLDDCRRSPGTVYVSLASDPSPEPSAAYESKSFGEYVVYHPHQ